MRPGAEQLYCTSVDGWTSGSPVAAAQDRGRGAMLAIGMNGEPLPIEHGFPARLVTPGLYGYVSATKWVDRHRGDHLGRAAGVLAETRLEPRSADQDGIAHRLPPRVSQTVP